MWGRSGVAVVVTVGKRCRPRQGSSDSTPEADSEAWRKSLPESRGIDPVPRPAGDILSALVVPAASPDRSRPPQWRAFSTPRP